MLRSVPIASLRSALVAAALASVFGPFAQANCPRPQRSVGWIEAATDGSVSIERSGQIYSAHVGTSICTNDRLIAAGQSVRVNLKCEGERTIASGRELQIGPRKWYADLCLAGQWSALFAQEKRDASARAVTLSPSSFAFLIPGLENGRSMLAKVPRSLSVPVYSLFTDRIDGTLVSPEGKIYKARVSAEDSRARLIFSGIKSSPGEWGIEVRNGSDVLFGSFTAGAGTQKISRGASAEELLASACGDPERQSLVAYNSVKPADEQVLLNLLGLWSSPESDSLCALD
jgi:hypothetical protein